LAAADQFLLHARKFEDWGYTKLAARIDAALLDTREQTDLLLRRMLFIGGSPDFYQRDAMAVANAVREMLGNDVDMHVRLAAAIRAAMACCVEEQEFQSFSMLARMLDKTEDGHINGLERQLAQIEAMGLETYLSVQL
jgi:bacterioferritin